jgi:hypothetical protein
MPKVLSVMAQTLKTKISQWNELMAHALAKKEG